jgi:hypothetical protein
MNTNNEEITLTFWLKLGLSFKYISNFAIIIGVLAFYMNAMQIFFICAPLIIVNFLVITIIQIFELDSLVEGIFGKHIKDKKKRESLYNDFVILSNIWHFAAVFWLYLVLHSGLIKLYKPNFMGIFFISILIPITYFIVEMKHKIYGDINYIAYFIMYVIFLFITCIQLYY